MENNSNNNNGQISANFTLMTFAMNHGKILRAGNYTNTKTNQPFVALIFPNDPAGIMVSVSSKLGKFNDKEELKKFVLENKDKLQVVQIDNPEYKKPLFSLCWQAVQDVTDDIDLFA